MQSNFIERKPLHEEVADRLREMITEGLLPAGSKLNERVLSEQLQVSRTPLREAIKMLAAEKLVDLLPNRGAVVAALNAETVLHLFELMSSLEGLSGELAAQRCDEATLREIRALHFEMLAAHARSDLPLYYRCNKAIHEAINRAAGNPVLVETYDAINLRIQAFRFRSNFNRDKWDRAMIEHQHMMDALIAKDGKALRLLLEQHLRNKRDAVIDLVLSDADLRAA
jgi:DNA-binding GntR family transcriptional regulator